MLTGPPVLPSSLLSLPQLLFLFQYCCVPFPTSHQGLPSLLWEPLDFSPSPFFFFLPASHIMQKFPDQGLNPRALQWKHGVLTIGPPGKSHPFISSTLISSDQKKSLINRFLTKGIIFNESWVVSPYPYHCNTWGN